MVNVLQDWDEVGNATMNMRENELPCHSTVFKDWDLWSIYNLIKDKDRNIRILDFGCSGCRVLNLLSHLGFVNVYGIDLYGSKKNFLVEKFNMALKNPSFKIIRGDGLRYGFPSDFFDVVISLSVIEHHVDSALFLRTCRNVLKDGCVLYLSTDYWMDKIETNTADRIFSEEEISIFLRFASEIGFGVDKTIPKCKDQVVFANGLYYTFISAVFEKLRGAKDTLNLDPDFVFEGVEE